jgi:hypothetical protein
MLDSLVDLRNKSGESLVLLTESPHSNIIKWASPLYESSGALKKMIATGFHKTEVWESVLFQIMHILYILQNQKIYFEELSLENNIFIKDLYYDSNTLNYWIYKIGNFNYYVPNYGYLVLFDSKYSDLKSNDYKIKSSKLFKDKNDKKDENNDTTYNFNYKEKIYDQFKKLFNPDIFNSQLRKMGGLQPDNHILTTIRGIFNYTNPDINKPYNIEHFIENFYHKYLNNRIGINLNRPEKETINTRFKEFIPGKLLIKQDRYDEYKWVLCMNNMNNNTVNIMTDIKNRQVEDCNTHSLFGIPPTEKITPLGIEENKIIETSVTNYT